MSVFEKTLTDKSGKAFDVIIPGDTYIGDKKDKYGGAEVDLLGSKIKITGIDIEKEYGWKRVMAIHSHQYGGDTHFSNDYGTFGGMEGDIPTGVKHNLKILLVNNNKPFIQLFDPAIYYQKNPNGMRVGYRFEHDEAAKAATNEHYIFIEK